MADTTTTAALYSEDAVVVAAEERFEAEWLLAARREAARAFAAAPVPTPQIRAWKYTDVTDLTIESFTPWTPTTTVKADQLHREAFAGTLREAADDQRLNDDVRERLGSIVPSTEGRFIAANAAHWSDGLYLRLPKGVALSAPVVVTIDASEAPAGSAIYPRILIDAHTACEAVVVVRFISGDQPLLVSSVIEIHAADDAKVRLLLDDRWGAATQEFTTARSRLGRAANVQVSSLAIGGALIKQTVEALIEGEGAHSDISGVALGDTEQHFDFVTLQDHIGPRTTSNVEIKAALAGSSRSIYYGVTRVEVSAKGAQANQTNRNLLLSGNSKADSDPVLEILTSDVIRCGHAATVGPVDEEALFYLQSRGLPRRSALQLLVTGFFQSVVEDIPIDGLAEELEEIVVEKLANAKL